MKTRHHMGLQHPVHTSYLQTTYIIFTDLRIYRLGHTHLYAHPTQNKLSKSSLKLNPSQIQNLSDQLAAIKEERDAQEEGGEGEGGMGVEELMEALETERVERLRLEGMCEEKDMLERECLQHRCVHTHTNSYVHILMPARGSAAALVGVHMRMRMHTRNTQTHVHTHTHTQ